jgi:osmotically-inducible protein OsmY
MLTGMAHSEAEKDRAQKDAWRVKGVQAVHNDIKVPD